MSSHLLLGTWDQRYSTAPTRMLCGTESVRGGGPHRRHLHGQDDLLLANCLSRRDSRRLTPTSELESSHLVADVQMGESSPRSYSTDNGAEALRSLAIVYQVAARRCAMQGLPLNTLYRALWRVCDSPAPAEQ
jgi:hypothetical protein